MSVIFNQVRMILHENFSFSYDQIQLETKFELELGMDSLEMRELLAECEQRFKIQVLWDDIDQLVETGKQIQIQDLVDYIAERQNQID
jgi:acyl carrier protein